MGIPRSRLLAAVALCVQTSLRVAAQGPPVPVKPAEPKPDAPKSSFVIEEQHWRAKFENDGSGRRELILRVKILDEQAVNAWGQFPLAYDSATEELTITRVEVRKPDGRVTVTPESSTQDFAVRPFPQLPIFLDVHQKVATISALRPGDVLFVNAVWTTTHPLIPGHFCFQHTFDTGDIVQDEQLEVDVPAARALVLKNRPGAPAEEAGGTGIVTEGRRLYRWRTSNPIVANDDTNKDDQEDAPSPDVRLTTFRNWDEVGQWYRGLIPTAADPAVSARAAEITKGLADPGSKIDAIYAYVATQIRYVSLSFGIGRFAPHSPAQVLANQYGDCKDKETLLSALLAAAGISSAPVLVNTTRSVEDDVPSPFEFNHMVAVVTRDAEPLWLWLDSTAEVAPPGMLIPSVRHRKGLFVGDATLRTRLITTPADPPFANMDRIDIDGKVDEIGALRARVTYKLRSDAELLVRSALRALPREAWTDLAKGLASESGLEGEVNDVSASDPTDTKQPLQIAFTIRRSKYLSWAARSSEVPVSAPALRMAGWKEDDRTKRVRIRIGSPGTTALHLVVEFPSGYSLESPTPVTTVNAAVEYRSTYRADGTRLIVDRELRVKAREIAAAQFGEYAVFIRAVEADHAQRVKVRGSVTSTPAVPPDATALEVYYAGMSAWETSNYESAAVLWKRSAELDPKMGDAWISLGLAYGKLKKYDQAAAAIQKQIDLDPHSNRASSDLGFVYKNAGRHAEAAKAYAKHVELNPLDGEAFRELGGIYLELERYQETAACLERAVTLLKKDDGPIYTKLGTAYLHTKENDKAIRAFDKAVAVDPSPEVLATIAWHLAVEHVDLDRAAILAKRVLAQASERTKDLTLAAIGGDDLDLMERVYWAWDALGWIHFQKGDLPQAERYLRAAWLFGGGTFSADHLGQFYERTNRLADASSFYLTAQAFALNPPDELVQRVKHLAPGGDVSKMLEAARIQAKAERVVRLPGNGPEGIGEFLVIVGPAGKALEVKFVRGDESVRALEPRLRDVKYPVEMPDEQALRLVLGLKGGCRAPAGCAVGVLYPDTVTLPKK